MHLINGPNSFQEVKQQKQSSQIDKHFKFDPIYSVDNTPYIIKKQNKKPIKRTIQIKNSILPELEIIKKSKTPRYQKNQFQQTNLRHKSLSMQHNQKSNLNKTNFIFSLEKVYNPAKDKKLFTISTSKAFVITNRLNQSKRFYKEKRNLNFQIQEIKSNSLTVQQQKCKNHCKIARIYRSVCEKESQQMQEKQQNKAKIKYSKLNQLIKAESIDIGKNSQKNFFKGGKIISIKKQKLIQPAKRSKQSIGYQTLIESNDKFQFQPWNQNEDNFYNF